MRRLLSTFRLLAALPSIPIVHAVDNCTRNPMVTRQSSTNNTCPIIIVHWWTATDACSNSVTACQTNIVECPPDICVAKDIACLHGNWEHVRHSQAGSKGNFHSHSFDSLMCACLACAGDPGSGVVVGDLCNPNDRTCGPEPRRAPANKICFSGVGDYTMTSGGRVPRSVLFRVDIEDHSEPGNNGKPSEDPSDRYRIRIWVLTTAEAAQLTNPSDRLLNFRRAIACTTGSTATQDGAPGALGSAVFGVRAPDIDDGGELAHGNHQIHPMIKSCP